MIHLPYVGCVWWYVDFISLKRPFRVETIVAIDTVGRRYSIKSISS
jgi:hypothetical protein